MTIDVVGHQHACPGLEPTINTGPGGICGDDRTDASTTNAGNATLPGSVEDSGLNDGPNVLSDVSATDGVPGGPGNFDLHPELGNDEIEEKQN